MATKALLLLILAAGCRGPEGGEGDGSESAPPITTVSAGSTGVAESSSGGGVVVTTGDAEETGAPAVDMGGVVDMGAATQGCGGKVDILFVVSRDGGMKYVYSRLKSVFPRFLEMIEGKYPHGDYHIMVVDGGPEWGTPQCTEDCPQPFQTCTVYDYPCDELELATGCDKIFGAGSRFPAGTDAANEPCPIEGGGRFMTRGQSHLVDTFACAAKVGLQGRGWIGQALTAALSHQLTGPGGCNDGFLRDDAVLLVVMVSGVYDSENTPDGSKGTPAEWAEAVIAAKHGDPEAVVMLNIMDRECPWWDRTCALAQMFPYHYIVDKDELDYQVGFEQASGYVQLACEQFAGPPG